MPGKLPTSEMEAKARAMASLEWPPREGVDRPVPGRVEPAAEKPRPWIASGSSLDIAPPSMSAWEQFERTWLGVTRLPLHSRLLEAGWTPEAPGRACPRCGTTVGAYESDATGCPACRERRLAWSRAVRLGEYEGELREIVHDIKFTAWRRLGRESGRLLGAAIAAALDDAGVTRDRVLLVPVPTTLLRLWSRGIDHTLTIARGVRDVAGGRIERCLRRSHRPPQTSLPATRRARNVHGTMRCGRAWTGREVVVVIDDVRTTGATMAEAGRALVRHLAKGAAVPEVWTAVLGVTPGVGRRGGVVAEAQPTEAAKAVGEP